MDTPVVLNCLYYGHACCAELYYGHACCAELYYGHARCAELYDGYAELLRHATNLHARTYATSGCAEKDDDEEEDDEEEHAADADCTFMLFCQPWLGAIGMAVEEHSVLG